MKANRAALIGAVASVALLGTAAAGLAPADAGQPPTAQQGRVIEVPPGAVVLVLPAGSVPMMAQGTGPLDAAFPLPAMPSPITMIRDMDRQMDAMMATMQRSFQTPAWLDANRTIQAALRGAPIAGGPIAGVVVTTFTNGHGTCTQRVIYRGNGTAPVTQVSSTGDGCQGAGLPTASPTPMTSPAPARPAPHVINVRDQSRPVAPLTYAMEGQ